jgi:hypothetical protein
MTSSAVASCVGGIVTPKCAHATLSDAKMAHCMSLVMFGEERS